MTPMMKGPGPEAADCLEVRRGLSELSVVLCNMY